RSKLECASLSLSDVVSYSSVSSVNDITTLQGLEYAQGVDSDTDTPIGLTSLTLDGYDLSGDINDNAEYDKLVVRILSKAVTAGDIDSGLTHLSVSGCGLNAVSDVLDLTPINSYDTSTQPFKLTYLDLSNNSISDVSVLLTSDLFPADALTTLDISSNNICDIDNVVTDLQSKFTNLSTLIYSDQTCHCSASVSSSAHQVCREVYPDRWAVECWNGYYLDKSTGTCVETTDSSDIIRCQVCERNPNMMAVLEEGASSITCGCRSAWYGDNCDQLYQVHIPDFNLRDFICTDLGYSTSDCDISAPEIRQQTSALDLSGYVIHDLTGIELYSNVPTVSLGQSSVESVLPLDSLGQIYSLDMSSISSLDGIDSFENINRLRTVDTYSNEDFFDLSMFYRNLSLNYIRSSDKNDTESATLVCRSEDDSTFLSYISKVFPEYTIDTDLLSEILTSDCANTGNSYCDATDDHCPSIVLNEVYNPVTAVKECSAISKLGSNGECFTIHDDQVRLSFNINQETITTLRGIEYLQGINDSNDALGLTYGVFTGYDLSGRTNINAEYDRKVIKMLAKRSTIGNINTGLTYLNVASCGLSSLDQVLDFTPIVSGDPATNNFRLDILYLSNNSISDISQLMTESLFHGNILETLDVSYNNICDIDGMVSQLQFKFTILSTITYNDQICHCSAPVSSVDHQVCREVYPDRWAVECWNGYYLDKATGECVEATDSNVYYSQVCEPEPNMMAVLEPGASVVACGCRSAWYGDNCDQLYEVHIPDFNLRSIICEKVGYSADSLCDVSEFEISSLGSMSIGENERQIDSIEDSRSSCFLQLDHHG
ncbi:hypothetical protein ADUPG1_007260, partial [Aduncisulcus paluster]